MENKTLKQLILTHSGYDQKIYDNTSIVRDLGIEHENAKAFIEVYSEKFHVDISTFDFPKYFPLESTSSNRSRRAELTVADLERAILAGELNDDVINFDENDPNLAPKFTLKNILLGVLLVVVVTALLVIASNFI